MLVINSRGHFYKDQLFYAHCLWYFAILSETVFNSAELKKPSLKNFSANSDKIGASTLLNPTPFFF